MAVPRTPLQAAASDFSYGWRTQGSHRLSRKQASRVWWPHALLKSIQHHDANWYFSQLSHLIPSSPTGAIAAVSLSLDSCLAGRPAMLSVKLAHQVHKDLGTARPTRFNNTGSRHPSNSKSPSEEFQLRSFISSCEFSVISTLPQNATCELP